VARQSSGTRSNWSNGVVPGTTDTAIIDNVGHQPVTIGDAEQVANLVIDSHATLEIADGGALTVTNALDDAGTIDVNAAGFDPTLVMYGPVRVEAGAGIDADGTFASVTFFKDQVGNAGDISANNQGTVLFEGSVVFNQDGGVIEAATLSTVTFDNATIANQGGATIEANGGQVLFDHSTITNDESHHVGLIEASAGGTVSFIDSSVAGSDGSIQATQSPWLSLPGRRSTAARSAARVRSRSPVRACSKAPPKLPSGKSMSRTATRSRSTMSRLTAAPSTSGTPPPGKARRSRKFPYPTSTPSGRASAPTASSSPSSLRPPCPDRTTATWKTSPSSSMTRRPES
jgi:hypothetical protein